MQFLNAEQVVEKFNDLLAQVQEGEEISIHDSSGKVIARLAPPRLLSPRIPGLDADTVQIADDFNAPLPDDLLDSFEGVTR